MRQRRPSRTIMGTADIFQKLFKYTVILYPLLTTSTTVAADVLYNSSLACTRGVDQTPHRIDCEDTRPTGIQALLFIRRVFYGTTPLSSGCNINAPKEACCPAESPTEDDCVFEDDSELDTFVKKCSGTAMCSFDGRRVSTSLGNCSGNNSYPALTSFSFIEYECISKSRLMDVTTDFSLQDKQEVYLDSNNYYTNTDVFEAEFRCLASTSCGSTLIFTAIDIQLKDANATHCHEELYFGDIKYPNVTANVTCQDDDLIHDVVLFESQSNAAEFNLSVPGNHTGKVFMRVRASQDTALIKFTCGNAGRREVLTQIEKCPHDHTASPDVSPSTFSTTISTPAKNNSTTVTTKDDVESGSNDDMHPGTIAGIVLALIAIIVVVILIILLIVHRRRYGTPADNERVIHSTDDPSLTYSQLGPYPDEGDSAYNSLYGMMIEGDQRRGHTNTEVDLGGLAPVYGNVAGATGYAPSRTGAHQSSLTDPKKHGLPESGPVVVPGPEEREATTKK